jgi:hypothetical protein
MFSEQVHFDQMVVQKSKVILPSHRTFMQKTCCGEQLFARRIHMRGSFLLTPLLPGKLPESNALLLQTMYLDNSRTD